MLLERRDFSHQFMVGSELVELEISTNEREKMASVTIFR